VLEVESNILAFNRLRDETEHQIMDRKGKKAVSTSKQVRRSSDGRIDEMGKLLKHLSDKIDRLEVGGRNRNQNRAFPEMKEIRINLEDLLPLDFFQEKEEIMIYKGKDRKTKNKKFNPLFKTIISEGMNHMNLMKVS